MGYMTKSTSVNLLRRLATAEGSKSNLWQEVYRRQGPRPLFRV